MNEPIGYCVVEYNQASGQPRAIAGDVETVKSDAEVHAEQLRGRAAHYGRLERYAVCEVSPVEDPR